jgi:hypothetical protein
VTPPGEQDEGHDSERHGRNGGADDGVHDAPGPEGIGGQPVDRIALRPTAVVGQPELLQLGEQVSPTRVVPR